jgi:hypothetical protein
MVEKNSTDGDDNAVVLVAGDDGNNNDAPVELSRGDIIL